MTVTFKRYGYLTGLVALLLLIGSAQATTRVITFNNNTGQNANDLHVEFVQGTTAVPDLPSQNYGAFPNENGSGTSTINFSGGTVNNNGSTAIRFRNGSSRITVKKWWWTLNGRRIGRIMSERNLAMATFDQLNIRPGEYATVAVYAAAQLDKDTIFELKYSITTPDGTSYDMPAMELVVPAGNDLHQQSLAVPLTERGAYHLTYSATNLETGEEVSTGDATLMVDDGINVLPEPIQSEEPTQTP
ncbi:MAG: hypothetical protein Tsb002_33570 [Wenzhouxiangellaceae bacterium]